MTFAPISLLRRLLTPKPREPELDESADARLRRISKLPR